MDQLRTGSKLQRATPAVLLRLSPTRRWALVGAVALVVIIGAVMGYRTLSTTQTTYKTATVTQGSIEQNVTALGELQPKDYVDVGAQASGTLEAVHVEVGDLVTKGELLAEIDPTVYESAVAVDKAKINEIQAQINGLQAQLDLAKIQDRRNQGLLKIDAVSKDVAETSAAQVKLYAANLNGAKAQLEQAQSALSGDEASLSYTKIYAPMTGTVTSQTTLQGQTLNDKQSAPTILQIADLTTMTVKAQVAEADVSKLKPGMPVYFTTLGMPERKWVSTVRQILPTPETINDVILYNALIDVKNPDNALMTSMTAQVFFVLGEAKDVPIVPVAALKPSRSGKDGAYRVLVMNGNSPTMTDVTIGLQNRVSAQVLSGLKDGDVVVTGVQSATSSKARSSSLGDRGGPRL